MIRFAAVLWVCAEAWAVAGGAGWICGVNCASGSITNKAPEDVTGVGPVSVSGAVAASNTAGDQRVLLIRIDFSDWPGAPFEEVAGWAILTNVHLYMEAASRGRVCFLPPGLEAGTGSAQTPTLRMPQTAAFYGTNNAVGPLRADARAAALAAGYDLDDYDFDVIALGAVPGFTWNGLGVIGAPGAWIRGTSLPDIVIHELGHNLGLHHANGWDTGGRGVIGEGVSFEYGDLFDTMGSGGSGRVFNTRYKRLLGWLDEEETLRPESDGVYRLFAHDVAGNEGRLQALIIPRANGTNYWIEYRRAITNHPWTSEGVLLRWAPASNQSSLLLDTTPGSVARWNDAPLLEGRTFSDERFGFHLTVLGRADTQPPSMDVAIYRNAFPDNQPPSVILAAESINVPLGQSVAFTSTALDPDGDALAYRWDFGDGSAGASQSATTHTWSEPGQFRVQCAVSDLKGGMGYASVVVEVAEAMGYRVAGAVFGENDRALGGVRVSILGGGSAFTDSDGTYTITGVTPGVSHLTAIQDGYQFLPSSFVNPISVTTDQAGLDFKGAREPNRRATVLVPAGNRWRYLDDGSQPSLDWASLTYEDGSWREGWAQLGYGDGDETTLIEFGPFPNNRYVTTYFRRSFSLADPAGLASLTLGLLRDDGAAVYLNGREVLRSNLPGGALTSQTLALRSLGAGEERTYVEITLPPAALRVGSNMLAVEVHQQDQDSSDLSFDAYLEASPVSELPIGVTLAEVSGQTRLIGPTDLWLYANAWAGSNAEVVEVRFFEGDQLLGSVQTRPYVFEWGEVDYGVHLLAARALDEQGRWMTSAPIELRVGAMLIPAGSSWRYLESGVDPGPTWTDLEFGEPGWEEGGAPLGYGDGDEVTRLDFGSDPTRKPITVYFRRTFEWTEVALPWELRFLLQRDDGAVVHLNAAELYRSNMPAFGAITATTLASDSVGDPEENDYLETITSGVAIRPGANVVAIDVHQSSAGSSDLSFDLDLAAFPGGFDPPRLTVDRVGDALRIAWPAAAGEWTLEVTDELSEEGIWYPTSDAIELREGFHEIRTMPWAPGLFYRLRRP